VLAISARWKEPEMKYREWAKSGVNFKLGEVQFVQVASNLWVANMIGQRDTKKDQDGNPPVRYEAIADGLKKVGSFAAQHQASVHMPRIGCGLAGGTWDNIEPLIKEGVTAKGTHVCVYDFS
jgi:hypothetical protein